MVFLIKIYDYFQLFFRRKFKLGTKGPYPDYNSLLNSKN